ncbi:Abi family protein [Alkalihalobacillus oceani]|uniref:Abi family protein n=1 Tax=Halalkalibacter oceani TaxID=1653776 RepID=UPI00203CC3ED|nr:Abi family protein [Halalkalibacter oceani]MCM3763178.1 Abi family protein [Halalkalibacter oceani]
MDEGYPKKPLNFSEQLELLKKRGIDVEHSEFASSFLSRVNYYRFTAYLLSYKKGDMYIEGTSFNRIVSIYEFDKKLRNLLIGVIEEIEIAFRTHIAYHHAHKYGPFGYEDASNFLKQERHQEFLKELHELRDRNRHNEDFIRHHFKKYNGRFPLWVIIEISSLGTLSKLFKNLKEEDKKLIAKQYYNIPYWYIESWLHTLTLVRNLCAHYNRLYNRKLKSRPQLFKDIKDQIDNHKIFSSIYTITRLLPKAEKDLFLTNLTALVLQYEEEIDLGCLGFPEEWEKILK